MARFTVGSVTSKDGTKISYRKFGEGPSVLLLHGGMQAAQDFTLLAEALSNSFSVYVPDRRGRGLSKASDCANLTEECQDLEAMLHESGAHQVFGLSSGAIVALYGALRIPAIQKIAVYEPPLSIRGSSPTAWLARYEREIQEGKLDAALATVMKGLEISPVFSFIPRCVLIPLLRFGLKRQPVKPGDIPIQELIPTMKCDVRLVLETQDRVSDFAALQANTLLLGGNRGPAYLRLATDALEQSLPRARRITLRGLDHLGPSNEGKPEVVAAELRRFFL